MIHRRKFLRGLAGALVALPALESVRYLGGRRLRAEVVEGPPVYSVFVRSGNGVQQALNAEPERFFPAQAGALSSASVSGRAVAVLEPFLGDLIVVRGTRYGFSGSGCAHSGGLNQCLTAARVTGEGKDSLAGGPSLDWFLSTQIDEPGVEPLNLMSGPQDSYIAHGLSYSGPGQLRGAENNPFSVYQDLMGLSGAPAEVLEQIARRRMSVNDLVRDEMLDLMGNPDLSAGDRRRLDTHFEAIRDVEVGMACSLTDGAVAAMETISSAAADNSNRLVVAEMMMDLIALAFACDGRRTATLQIGSGNDGTRYYVDGALQNSFHRISHRIDGDGSDGPPIPDADLLHHEIDKLQLTAFRHLLERLREYPGPRGGTLLDECVAVWTNDLGTGPGHQYRNLPHVLAGSGAGFLRTGQFLDLDDVPHNKLLNTIANAVGIRKEGGEYFDSFGDESLEPGVIAEMIA